MSYRWPLTHCLSMCKRFKLANARSGDAIFAALPTAFVSLSQGINFQKLYLVFVIGRATLTSDSAFKMSLTSKPRRNAVTTSTLYS